MVLCHTDPNITFPTKENTYFHKNGKGCIFVFRPCTRPFGTFSSHKCLVFLIKDLLAAMRWLPLLLCQCPPVLSFWLRAKGWGVSWGDKPTLGSQTKTGGQESFSLPRLFTSCSLLDTQTQEETVPGPLHSFFQLQKGGTTTALLRSPSTCLSICANK